MRTPEEVIADSILFDYRPTSNAKRILAALREEGYVVVPVASKVDLPELARMYGGHAVSAEEATYWFNRAFEMGKEAA